MSEYDSQCVHETREMERAAAMVGEELIRRSGMSKRGNEATREGKADTPGSPIVAQCDEVLALPRFLSQEEDSNGCSQPCLKCASSPGALVP